MSEARHFPNYINGEWVDPISTDTINVVNPATEEVFETIAAGNHEDVDAAELGLDEAFADADAVYAAREEQFGADVMRQLERTVVLSVIDNKWREHLSEMDYLRAGIGLRAMGQRDPLTEYQREGFDMFTDMVEAVKRDSVKYLFHVELAQPKTQPQRVQAAPAGSTGSKKPVSVSDKIGSQDTIACFRKKLCPAGKSAGMPTHAVNKVYHRFWPGLRHPRLCIDLLCLRKFPAIFLVYHPVILSLFGDQG